MSNQNKNIHLTSEERKIIETGIINDSTKAAIAKTIGKDKSTIGKEIKSHRRLIRKCSLPLECSNYKRCKYNRNCTINCDNYVPFKCTRRDRSPGACNGCDQQRYCRFNQYFYSADLAQKEYKNTLSATREGINISEDELKKIGNLIQPLIKQGLSPYAILKIHPEITISEKTIYNYIETGIFKNIGVDLIALDLRKQVSRRINRINKNKYKIRKDKKYLKGRTFVEYKAYVENNPYAKVVQMDTVYNDTINGPFMQTFKFLRYSFMIIIYHTELTAENMYNGILLLEKILGPELFSKEVEVILTDRGSEFTYADKIEIRDDGSRRTRIYYCDPMCSQQKGAVENNHLEVRYICPKETNLYELGLCSQDDANLISSHINSFPKEHIDGKTPFELLKFLNNDLACKFIDFGVIEIEKDKVILKPYLLKNNKRTR